MRNAAIICLAVMLSGTGACAQAPVLSGEKAMDHVRAQVAFGPRPPGSEALQKCREYLIRELEGYGYQVERDAFEATTPYGPKPMVNLIAHKVGTGGGDKVIALASHYDTKYFQNIRFVGANDAGSSTGLLLELARVLASKDSAFDYWFLFLDGEEAFIEWSSADSTYGSRHLVKRWEADGTIKKVRALVLLDMVGDKDLGIYKESQSTPWLMDMVWTTAREAGLQDILSTTEAAVEDDHLPFLYAKIPSVDLIDLDYPPWHTEWDTLDKISPDSMEKVGKLVLALLPRLEERLSSR